MSTTHLLASYISTCVQTCVYICCSSICRFCLFSMVVEYAKHLAGFSWVLK